MSHMFDSLTLYHHPAPDNSWQMLSRKNHQFNQPLNKWNTRKVTDMSYMFASAVRFNQDISTWDTSKVTDMSFMFSQASAFNQPI